MPFLQGSTSVLPEQRPGAPTVTGDFAHCWRDGLESSLRGYLTNLGATPHEIDDVVQETALRAIEARDSFADETHLRRWCFVVARRCWIDVRRHGRRTSPLDEMRGQVDTAGADWVGRVEDRQILERISEVMCLLRPADREALLSPAPPASVGAKERNRRNVARHRARARLKVLIGPLAAATGWGLGGMLRRWPRAAAGGAAVPALLVVALSPLVGPATSDGVLLQPSTASASAHSDERVEHGSRPVRDPWPRLQALHRPAPAPAPAPATSSTPSDAAGAPLLPTIEGPAGTHASVERRQQLAGDALVCLSGDVLALCVDVAAGTSPEEANAAQHPGLAHQLDAQVGPADTGTPARL